MQSSYKDQLQGKYLSPAQLSFKGEKAALDSPNSSSINFSPRQPQATYSNPA